MSDVDNINVLISYIEETLRITSKKLSRFIDPQGFLTRLKRQHNHVVFGRRGAGKSLLTTSLIKEPDFNVIYINLEDFKDITFPNIIIYVLIKAFDQLIKLSSNQKPIIKGHLRSFLFRNKLASAKKKLLKLLKDPDVVTKNIRTKDKVASSVTAAAKNEIAEGSVGTQSESEQEVSKTIIENKLQNLRTELSFYKNLINNTFLHLDNKPIYLVLDDFYFIPKSTQSDFIDYFHRLTKDTELYIKVATIKHRSKLYRQTTESFIGTEIGADILDVDLDYTLDKFGILKTFMSDLLKEASKESGANLNIEGLFIGDGFSQLCLASGGVPRDFLSLFAKLGGKMLSGSIEAIGKIQVTETAIENINNKFGAFKTDSAGEREILELYLQEIRNYIFTKKRTNTFLILKSEMDSFPQERQAVRELVDLRLLHLLDNNTSCAPSDGRRYEAYMIDIGMYENSRPRNFDQIEPDDVDDNSRKDKLRASPKVSLQKLNELYTEKNIGKALEITD